MAPGLLPYVACPGLPTIPDDFCFWFTQQGCFKFVSGIRRAAFESTLPQTLQEHRNGKVRIRLVLGCACFCIGHYLLLDELNMTGTFFS